jgi:hypothetical protein
MPLSTASVTGKFNPWLQVGNADPTINAGA